MLIKLTNLVSKYNLNISGVAHFGAHLGQEVMEYEELNIKNIHLFGHLTRNFKLHEDHTHTHTHIHTYLDP